MSGLPWFRLYAEFAHDPEIQALAFEDQRHFVVALCLKCSGILDKDHSADQREKILTRALGLYGTAFHEATRRLVDAGLIDKNWQPCNWKKRQFISDTSTERVRKHRRGKQKNSEPLDATLQERPQIQIQSTDTEDPPNPLASKGAGSGPPDPLLDPFAPVDTLRAQKPSKDRKAEEARIGREMMKRTKVSDEDKPDPPYNEIAKLYVEICVPRGFLALKYLTPQRRREIRSRWYEIDKRQDLEWWRTYFEYVVTCKGLHEKNWANFGFLISDRMVDIAEGRYERAFTR